MFNSNVLEVAVGVIFTFLSISLATGAIVEALASITTWRSRVLLSGVRQLVNDPNFTGLARDLYQHALINPRGPGAVAPVRNMPAYIDPPQFANAMMELLGLTSTASQSAATQAGPPLTARLQAQVDNMLPAAKDPQMNAMLSGMIQRSGGEVDKIHQEMCRWFDNAMDRVSGTYKRYTQAIGLVVAFALCLVFNVDALHVTQKLWAHQGMVQMTGAGYKTTNPDDALRLMQSDLPVGWPQGHWFSRADEGGKIKSFELADVCLAVLGWLITAFATLFGAPFWFDILQSVVRLKGSGPSPAESRSGQAAAR